MDNNTIYNILLSDGISKADAERYTRQRLTTVLSAEEIRQHVNGYVLQAVGADDDLIERDGLRLAQFFESDSLKPSDSRLTDYDISKTKYNDTIYYIFYAY